MNHDDNNSNRKQPGKLRQAFNMTLDTVMQGLGFISTSVGAANNLANATRYITGTIEKQAEDYFNVTIDELEQDRADNALEAEFSRMRREKALADRRKELAAALAAEQTS